MNKFLFYINIEINQYCDFYENEWPYICNKR